MEPPAVRYATTSDGISIAWAEFGQGPPLLFCAPTPFTHVQELFAVFEPYYAALARSFRVITFDARGTGMSQRDVEDVATPTLLIDAEAVVDAAKLDRYVVVADIGLLPLSTALQLATVRSGQVTHLALLSPFQNMRELADTPYGRLGLALAEADWLVFVQTLVRVLGGWDPADSTWVDPMARAAATWVDPALGLQYTRIQEATDLSDLVAAVHQPTLVLRGEPSPVPARCCHRVAAKIPGSQFRQFSDSSYEQWAELVSRFAGLSLPEFRTAPAPTVSAAFRTVLFTDLVGHTEMMQRLGDTKGRDVLREHERITRETLKQYGGTEIKTDGDSFMVSFGSVTQAMDCAIALQRAFASHTESMPEPLHVRVGLNAGEPIEEDGDLFGSTVILASRIAAQAGGGEILIPEPLRHLLSGKNYVYADRGVTALKGFEDPVRLYEVHWRQ